MRKELTDMQRLLNQRSLSMAACATWVALASCSAPPGADDDSGLAEFGGPLPGAGAPSAPAAQNPAPGPGAAPAANTTPGTAATPPGEQPASNGTPLAPSAPPVNGGSNAGASSGAGGAAMIPTSDGAGGSSMNVGAGGAAPLEPAPIDGQPPVTPPPPPVTPPPVDTPAAPPAPAGPDIPCPADAFFCSGFENGFPEGTANIIGGGDTPNAFALDTTQVNSGSQSLFLAAQPTMRFTYRVLAVPVDTQQFWARLFFRTDVAFGSSTVHEAIIAPSAGSLTQDNNNEGRRIELSEQFGYMLLNVNDATSEPAVRTQLSANEWHCIEARYDTAAGQVEIFADGEQFINDEGPLFQLDVQTFRLGYMQFNGTVRNVWYDDVILSPNRVGCN